MLHAPVGFRGSWLELYRDHIEPNLPAVKDVSSFHEWLMRYCKEPSAVFPLRMVTGAKRRQLYSTCDGSLIAPADNAPAWAVHALLVERKLSSYHDFKMLMASMPAHMFDIGKIGVRTANSYGWYIAHIFPAKNGDTQFRLWTRDEVKKRCFLTLHPCNIFPVPGVRNRQHGEDPKVIAFVAEQYAIRYRSMWSDFLGQIKAAPLASNTNFGSEQVLRDSISIERTPTRKKIALTEAAEGKSPSIISYSATRLTFKRDRIEPLGTDEQFEVVTPMGIYRFTKRAFYSEFGNITRSVSYREKGSYNGKQLHLKAQMFRVPNKFSS
jgi:hypothetical protein